MFDLFCHGNLGCSLCVGHFVHGDSPNHCCHCMLFVIHFYLLTVKLVLMTLNVFIWIVHAYFFSHQDVFYSRKNFKRPDLQMNPHQAFEQEVALLDSFFKGIYKPKCEFHVFVSVFCPTYTRSFKILVWVALKTEMNTWKEYSASGCWHTALWYTTKCDVLFLVSWDTVLKITFWVL